MSGNITPNPIHPKEKYLIQTHFFEVSPNLHDCVQKRTPSRKFGSSEELLDVAKQENIR
jgi:hypothetical protein